MGILQNRIQGSYSSELSLSDPLKILRELRAKGRI